MVVYQQLTQTTFPRKHTWLELFFDFTQYNRLFLRDGKRPHIRTSDSTIISPCDCTLQSIQPLTSHCTIQGKMVGRSRTQYSFQEIVHRKDDQHMFDGGTVFYLYLSPFNLHYCLFPSNCMVRDIQYNPNTCKPLWLTSQAAISNERIIIHALNHNEIPFIIVMVGSFLVSGIECMAEVNQSYQKNAILGGFKQGSLVILLFPKDTIHITTQPGSRLLIGEPIAMWR